MRERRLRPQPRVQSKKAHERSHHGHTGCPGISRANGFTAYSRLSPAIGLLVTVIGVIAGKHPRRFDASVEASGPHGFAVRVGAIRHEHLRVHRIPHPRS
jgi:hypothetical protein